MDVAQRRVAEVQCMQADSCLQSGLYTAPCKGPGTISACMSTQPTQSFGPTMPGSCGSDDLKCCRKPFMPQRLLSYHILSR